MSKNRMQKQKERLIIGLLVAINAVILLAMFVPE
jgi:hypothetical protein